MFCKKCVILCLKHTVEQSQTEACCSVRRPACNLPHLCSVFLLASCRHTGSRSCTTHCALERSGHHCCCERVSVHRSLSAGRRNNSWERLSLTYKQKQVFRADESPSFRLTGITSTSADGITGNLAMFM